MGGGTGKGKRRVTVLGRGFEGFVAGFVGHELARRFSFAPKRNFHGSSLMEGE
jgi:hypothetical protein